MVNGPGIPWHSAQHGCSLTMAAADSGIIIIIIVVVVVVSDGFCGIPRMPLKGRSVFFKGS